MPYSTHTQIKLQIQIATLLSSVGKFTKDPVIYGEILVFIRKQQNVAFRAVHSTTSSEKQHCKQHLTKDV